MTDENDPRDQIQTADVRTAVTALIHWLTADPLGLRETITPAENNGRMTAVLLGTFDIMAQLFPEIRDPENINHLRGLVAQIAADEDNEDDQGDDTPKGPPKRIY